MSTVSQNKPTAQDSLTEKLAFHQKLQAITNRIDAEKSIDEIILELSQEWCNLFNTDRLTIFQVGDDRGSIISKVKTGLNSFKDIKLPISEQSIAGFVAANRRVINIRDVYDDAELKSYSPQLNFLETDDANTGYRTRQMLVAPIVENKTKELIGVVQIINTKNGQPFPQVMEEGVVHLCETLAIAFRQRQGPAAQVHNKYDGLVSNAVICAEELELAQRSARRKNLDLETVLIDEFQVKVPALGDVLASYFGVPYEPFKRDRIRPAGLLKNMKREYVEANQWLPVEETKEGLVVLSVEPGRVRSSRIVPNVFPGSTIIYKVTTQKEFNDTVDQFYGAKAVGSSSEGDLPNLVSKALMSAYASGGRERLVRETADLWSRCLIMLGRHGLGLSDVLAELRPRQGIADADERADDDK